jgi:hypothetical protein
MTAMKQAFEQAHSRKGTPLDDATKLRNEAEALLCRYDNNLVRAVLPFMRLMRSEPALLTELARQYLKSISVPAREPDAGAVPPDRVDQEQADRAGSETVEIGGYEVASYERAKPKPRSETEKALALQVAAGTAKTILESYTIMGRGIGAYHWHELEALSRENRDAAADSLEMSVRQTEMALVTRRLAATYQVHDKAQRVADVASPRRVAAIVQWAKHEAPRSAHVGAAAEAGPHGDPGGSGGGFADRAGWAGGTDGGPGTGAEGLLRLHAD